MVSDDRNDQRGAKAQEALKENLLRYRYLVENANDIIYEIDRTGFFRFFNPVAVRVTGYSALDLEKKHYLELIREDCREDARRFYESQCLRELPSTLYELPLVSKDGTEVWIEQRVQLMKKGDRIQGFHAVARDITERKRAEEAPRDTETRTAAIVNTAVDGSTAIDAQGLVGESAPAHSRSLYGGLDGPDRG